MAGMNQEQTATASSASVSTAQSQQIARDSARILDEWKANIDLHKFHEDLKHRRLSHFLTFEFGLVALTGILVKEALQRPPIWLALIPIAPIGFVIARTYDAMDIRARGYIDVVKGKLLQLERESAAQASMKLTTYTDQWLLLAKGDDDSRRTTLLREYADVRGEQSSDKLAKYLGVPAAGLGERDMFKNVRRLWVFVGGAAFVLFVAGAVNWLRTF